MILKAVQPPMLTWVISTHCPKLSFYFVHLPGAFPIKLCTRKLLHAPFQYMWPSLRKTSLMLEVRKGPFPYARQWLAAVACGSGCGDIHNYIWNNYYWVTSIYDQLGRRNRCRTPLPCIWKRPLRLVFSERVTYSNNKWLKKRAHTGCTPPKIVHPTGCRVHA